MSKRFNNLSIKVRGSIYELLPILEKDAFYLDGKSVVVDNYKFKNSFDEELVALAEFIEGILDSRDINYTCISTDTLGGKSEKTAYKTVLRDIIKWLGVYKGDLYHGNAICGYSFDAYLNNYKKLLEGFELRGNRKW